VVERGENMWGPRCVSETWVTTRKGKTTVHRGGCARRESIGGGERTPWKEKSHIFTFTPKGGKF